MDYQEFIRQKSQLSFGKGFKPLFMPDFLFDFQSFLVDWALSIGRASIFADCGMGKGPMALVWAENVVRKTNKPVLILTPLSVSSQMVEESEKFGVDAHRNFSGEANKTNVHITNYEKLHLFDPSDFGGVVCDESSIIKNFDGKRKGDITAFMRRTEFRLLCTATAAPNDYIELGTSSEALGYLGYMDMLSKFFKNDEDSINPAFIGTKWRFKYHAEDDFWRWMASWSRACRRPSDLGFSDETMVLPNLIENEVFVPSPLAPGMFIHKPAKSLSEQRVDTKETLEQRCEIAAHKMNHGESGLIWCHLNAEADLLEKMIPDAVQVKGPDKDEKKEEIFNAFRKGEIKKIVTKPKIAAFGMNWQHCNRVVYFPTHSYEQYYQAIRRCWRFGQKKDVTVDLITTEAQRKVLQNMKRKSDACDKMFSKLIENMMNATGIKRQKERETQEVLPKWL